MTQSAICSSGRSKLSQRNSRKGVEVNYTQLVMRVLLYTGSRDFKEFLLHLAIVGRPLRLRNATPLPTIADGRFSRPNFAMS